MNILGNILWLLFGGIIIALEYMVAGLLMCITIIGIPFGLQSFKLAAFVLWPFGKTTRPVESGSGCLSTVLNIVWIFLGGIWIALSHLFWGVVLCITIIGIPFGKQHFKMVSLALTPFGRQIVYK
ncbi:MAG TPA: YccF domain-containing protein [Bacteroidales bacterium]|nr:MAG: Inner membrane protein YccF [Bacteroidetes bacterium ADurb.Bin037]HPV88515.1 YccF domain-containing protein [Bacteroidales bacterium]HPW77661.1 YccF domain-containing protein [Bacteroidales bacterium]HQB55532.1 YccF domain-containing protein [Bacteroidales bacterium]